MDYSDFYDNTTNIGGSGVTGFGTLVGVNYNSDSCDCYSNIFLDPEFNNPSLDDYHLTVTSPCIDAGDPTFPYDPDGTITDMGMYYFNQTSIGEESEVAYGPGNILECLPNPCSELLAVNFNLPGQSAVEFRIYDLQGRLIGEMHSGQGTGEMLFDVTDISAGIYFCRMISGGFEATQRIVVIQ